MSCNFSAETLEEEEFGDRCREILETYQFPKRQLIFQIPEKAVREGSFVVTEHIKQIKAMGIRIALDDFGESFASFSDIETYMPDVLQLDKRLVDLLGTGPGNAAVRAMIQVGRELGITVMAEGAQEEEQVRLLREMGCNVIEGYYFYRPIPSWEAAKKLLDQSVYAEKGGV